MIEFPCPGCGQPFSVPDSYSGRKATCNRCGAELRVPRPMPAPPKLPVRTRRLLADLEEVKSSLARSQVMRLVETVGEPPDVYRVEFSVRSIERLDGDKPMYRDTHTAEIQLTSDYPRLSPKCKMLTPVFHPNIDETTICIGDHWTAGERLADLIIRIGEMLAYQAYNVKSPLNGEAAMWADLNPTMLPVDSRSLHPGDEAPPAQRETAQTAS